MVLVIFIWCGKRGWGDKSLARISIMKRTLEIFLRFFFNHLHSFLIHFFYGAPPLKILSCSFFCIAPRHMVCNQMVAVPVPRQLLKYLTTWTVKGALQLYNVTIKLQKVRHWLRLINKYKGERSFLTYLFWYWPISRLPPNHQKKKKKIRKHSFSLSNYSYWLNLVWYKAK